MQIIDHQSLSGKNSFGFAQQAERYADLNSVDDVLECREYCLKHSLGLTVIGEGSNLVLRDDIPGLTVSMTNRTVEIETLSRQASQTAKLRVRADAGVNWHQLVTATLEAGAYGLENLSLIPGSTGAAPVQNIGAYGVEIADSIASIECVDLDSAELLTLSAGDCAFAYRDSLFKRSCIDSTHTLSTGINTPRFLITSVTLDLCSEFNPALSYTALAQALEQDEITNPSAHDVSRIVCKVRRSKLPDPSRLGNAGSFFKNPVIDQKTSENFLRQWPAAPTYPQNDGTLKVAAGWLVEQCGWKGRSHPAGRVGVYEKQALVLVNHSQGNGQELLQLAELIKADVREKFAIDLEQEPRSIP